MKSCFALIDNENAPTERAGLEVTDVESCRFRQAKTN